MSYVAQTDVTAPPDGWSWAVADCHSWRPQTGEMRWIVSQDTPSGRRHSKPVEQSQRLALQTDWNNEAKASYERLEA